MNFEFQLNSNDCEEAIGEGLRKTSESESRLIHKWVLLIGVLFLVMGIISQEKGFLVVGVSLLSLPIFCKLFVRTGAEKVYEMYDLESNTIVDGDREMPSVANPTNYGEPMTVEVIGEGLVINTPSLQCTFKWESFNFFIECKNSLVIYPVPSLYPVSSSNFIIPKRAFSGEKQLSDFRELLHKNIGKTS